MENMMEHFQIIEPADVGQESFQNGDKFMVQDWSGNEYGTFKTRKEAHSFVEQELQFLAGQVVHN